MRRARGIAARWANCPPFGFVLIFSILALAARGAWAFDFSELYDIKTSPFLPIPEIGIDPNNGRTLGLIPAWLRTDDRGEVNRIIAPDVIQNSYFGWGLRGRIFDYPSEDTRWSLVAGLKERVERQFAAEYQTGRTRTGTWSFSASAIYDRSGTPRFFGFGNDTSISDQTDYTEDQTLLRAIVGWNISRTLQLGLMLRAKSVNITAGTLPNLPSITASFPGISGLGTNHELLSRVTLTYDSRDDLTVPTRGMLSVLYGGLSSREGIFNDSLYSEEGLDVRGFVPFDARTVLAMHAALRYLPSSHNLPFWAYSTIGGDRSVIGGEQALRGFGAGRFTDLDSFCASAELRHIITSLHLVGTRVDLEPALLTDLGRVFSQLGTSPFEQLHRVYGLGIRAIARPYVVAYIDVGRGSEGIAAFSGINYIF